MDISELFSTRERGRILRKLLYSSRMGSFRKTALETKVSPSQVHKYLKILKKRNIVSEDGKLCESALVKSLRLTENLVFLENMGLVQLLRSKLSGIKGVGIYGSWGNGTNNEKSDVDVWVLIDKQPGDLAVGKIRRSLEEKLGKTVDLTILTPERLAHIRGKNPAFYSSIFHSLKLWGDDIWSA